MTLKIKDTGIQINQDLFDYVNQKFEGVYFDEIYVELYNFDDESEELEFREKIVNITYPSSGPFLRNTVCLAEDELTQNTINWLKTL